MSSALEFAKRTMYCGEVRADKTGQEIILKGWVHRRRDHGRLMFIDLRDRTGLMQIRINPDSLENDAKLGVDTDIAFTGDAKELVEALQNLGSQQFKLRSISKGDVNIFPDGRPPKGGDHPYSARFMAEQRGAAGIGADAADTLTKILTEKGHKVSGKWFVSSTHDVREEYVIAVRGVVERRPEGATNPNLPTGETELVAKEIKILNSAAALPFRLDEHGKTNEELRLTYRYLDLRRPELQRHFIVRDKLYKSVRDYLTEKGFLEFETPILGKPTPEGARDFLVPSRLNAGLMYALPQSPQLFKQILMVAGFDRYFQIARCF
ncbi:MAG: amino acid--tRNA ligase-related protein, partial [Candidatus Sumerlaeota bacterium]